MENVLKYIKFKFDRVFKSKLKTTYLVIWVVLVSFFAIIYKENMFLNNSICSPSQEIMDNYERESEYNKTIYDYIEGNIDELPENFILPYDYLENTRMYKYNFLEYDYYIKHGTYRCDYLGLKYLNDNSIGNEEGVFLVNASRISFFVLIILSITLTLNVFYSNKENGFEKNLQQTNISNKEIFSGKSVFVIIILTLVTVGIILLSLLITYGDNRTSILIINTATDSVTEQTTVTYFLSKMTINFFVSICISGVTLVVRKKVGNSFLAGLITILPIAILIGIYYLMSLTYLDRFTSNIVSYIPIINAISEYIQFNYWLFYVSIILYFILYLICYDLVLKKNDKKKEI